MEVEVLKRRSLGSGRMRWTLRVLIRNHDSRRRWFVLPGRLGAPRPDLFEAPGRETLRFNEHVRAQMTHFKGRHDLYVLPLAGGSDAELVGWVVEGGAGDLAIDVVELDRFVVGEAVATFDKKVPYELRIGDARDTHVAWFSDVPVSVQLIPKETHTAKLGF